MSLALGRHCLGYQARFYTHRLARVLQEHVMARANRTVLFLVSMLHYRQTKALLAFGYCIDYKVYLPLREKAQLDVKKDCD